MDAKFTELLESATKFTSVAMHQATPTNTPIPEIDFDKLISESSSFMGRQSRKAIPTEETPQLDPYLDRLLRVNSQRLNESDAGQVVYSGETRGKPIFISQDAQDQYTIYSLGANGGRDDMLTYSTFEAAKFMLQSRFPDIIETSNSQFPVAGVSKEAVTPIDVMSIDAMLGPNPNVNEAWDFMIKTAPSPKIAGHLEVLCESGFDIATAQMEAISRDKYLGENVDIVVSSILQQINKPLSALTESQQHDLYSIAADVAMYLTPTSC